MLGHNPYRADVSTRTTPQHQRCSIRHAFTVDVEDWYHGIPLRGSASSRMRRLDYSLELLLELLAARGVRATFFWLACAAEEHPYLIQKVAAASHEIGCHGWSHRPIYVMSPQDFYNETQRSLAVLTDLIGQPVTTYRAAYFSVTTKTLWALEILAALGFLTDSSIFPVRHWRYGIPDFAPWPQRITTAAGPIVEMPISVRRVCGHNIPVSGGAYFRLYPYKVTHVNFQAIEQIGRPVIFYLHPWELDHDHPRVRFSWKAYVTHYANLRSTQPKLQRLLNDFTFAPLREIMADLSCASS